MKELTPNEVEIIECLAAEWDQHDMGMYGNISYQKVYDFLTKIGAEVPPNLKAIVVDNKLPFEGII